MTVLFNHHEELVILSTLQPPVLDLKLLTRMLSLLLVISFIQEGSIVTEDGLLNLEAMTSSSLSLIAFRMLLILRHYFL